MFPPDSRKGPPAKGRLLTLRSPVGGPRRVPGGGPAGPGNAAELSQLNQVEKWRDGLHQG